MSNRNLLKKSVKFGVILLALLVLVAIGYKSHIIRHQYYSLKTILKGGSVFDIRLADANSKKIYFFSNGLKIFGDLYPSKMKKSPCILLLHGTNYLGRKQPIVLAIAKELQKLNYTVLAIDFRGYNESQDPPKIDSVNDLDFAQDAISAIDYLVKNTDIDTSRIYILGHSFGAGVALEVQKRDKRVKKLVLLGPPRRVREKILDPLAKTRPFLISLFIRDMRLKEIPDEKILEQSISKRNISNYVKEFQKKGHIPVFLMDGGNEDPKDIEYLRHIYKEMVPPKSYWTIPGANHFLNTRFIFGKACYGENILHPFVKRVDEWLNKKQ